MMDQLVEAGKSDRQFPSGEDLFKQPDIAALNGYYIDGDSIDQDVFAEQRSNILLVAGEHYNRRPSNFYKRLRDARELSNEQKLRLTKNHVGKICKSYANNIVSMAPGVGFSPKDETSMHDRKVSDMHHSVWRDAVERYNVDDKIDDWCDSFIQIGEVAVKLFWDPNLGKVAGYEPQVDENGDPILNDFQQMIPDENKAVFEGEFVFEEIYGFNLLRPPECKDMRKAEWLCIRKMTDVNELKRKYKSDQEKYKFCVTNPDETYTIFDPMKGSYYKTKNQTMVREYYFRPSRLFPEGYFYITTREGILDEGALPGSHFPIIVTQFDKIQTTPRGRSPVKTMRPYQAEINRSASKIAEHQITLGDDKLLIQNGTKVSAGASLPGVRAVNYTGQEPKILAGRDGSQYLNYMTSQISELYQVMMVQEDGEEKQQGQMDPYALLFRSAKEKKKFQRYIKRFEKFLLEIVHLYLRLAKIHLPDDAVIWAIGKNEQINLPEFRQLPDTCYETKIEAQSDDIETKLGHQLVMNHVLQYASASMGKDDIGKIIQNMPFANVKESFGDLTMDYDSAQNEMLALDRGEQPPVNQYDNHVYLIKKLTNRTRMPDYKFLAPNVQQNYQMKIQVHQQIETANQAAIQRAEQGFIPTGGYLVTCQFYVQDPSDPTGLKTRQARVPYLALDWLIKQLESQGASQQQFADMSSGAQAQIANNLIGQGIPTRAPSLPGQASNPVMGSPQPAPTHQGAPRMM
jgi:hypothetical protein